MSEGIGRVVVLEELVVDGVDDRLGEGNDKRGGRVEGLTILLAEPDEGAEEGHSVGKRGHDEVSVDVLHCERLCEGLLRGVSTAVGS